VTAGDLEGVETLAPDDADRIWHEFLDGLWRIVRRGDEAGLRRVVLRRATPAEVTPLSAREREALALAARGASNKAIGFTLAVAPSTAAGVLDRACRKLGLASRRELIELFGSAAAPPGGSRVRSRPD
jgi:DNA-binding CsgD family transcriptional regulator